jgi:hypothetical protein
LRELEEEVALCGAPRMAHKGEKRRDVPPGSLAKLLSIEQMPKSSISIYLKNTGLRL